MAPCLASPPPIYDPVGGEIENARPSLQNCDDTS
jgi:hypothetical protein